MGRGPGEAPRLLPEPRVRDGHASASRSSPTPTSRTAKKKPAKWLTLEIPVTEGDQYRVGEMKFEGLTVFKEEGVRTLFKLQPGDVYNESKFKKGYEKLRDLYGSTGLLPVDGRSRSARPIPRGRSSTSSSRWKRTSGTSSGRSSFTGNDTTRDKVIRREIYMNEGDVFNTEALKPSIRRVNQLGYFKPMEGAPDFQPSALGRRQARRDLQGRGAEPQPVHLRRRRVGARGDVPQRVVLDRELPGRGRDPLRSTPRPAERTKNYQIAVTEPYFLDRPITAGFDLFKRKITYDSYGTFVGYTQGGTGVTATTGLPVQAVQPDLPELHLRGRRPSRA